MTGCGLVEETRGSKWNKCQKSDCLTNKTCYSNEWFSCSNRNSCAPLSSCQLPINTSSVFYEIFSNFLTYLGNNGVCSRSRNYELRMGDYNNSCDKCLPWRLKIDRDKVDCLSITKLLSEHVQINADCQLANCQCHCNGRVYCKFKLKAIPPTTVQTIHTTSLLFKESTSQPLTGIASTLPTDTKTELTTLYDKVSVTDHTGRNRTGFPSKEAKDVSGGSNASSSAMTGALIGGVAVLIIVLLVGFVLVCLRKRGKRNKQDHGKDHGVCDNSSNVRRRQILTPYTTLLDENGHGQISNQTYDNLRVQHQTAEMTKGQYDYVDVFSAYNGTCNHSATNNAYVDIEGCSNQNYSEIAGMDTRLKVASTTNEIHGVNDYITLVADQPIEGITDTCTSQTTEDTIEMDNYFILEPEDSNKSPNTTSEIADDVRERELTDQEMNENHYNTLVVKIKEGDKNDVNYYHVRHVNAKVTQKPDGDDYDELKKPYERQVVRGYDDEYDHCPIAATSGQLSKDHPY